jgi:hypothetical protein
MIRWFLKTNITDPLSTRDRGIGKYKQFFSGDNTANQVNYLEYEPVDATAFRVHVYVGGAWVLKTGGGTHYTLDTSNHKITWNGYTVPTGNDNVRIEYDHVKGWVFDNRPRYDASYYPRISVQEISSEVQGKFLGLYQNFSAGCGDFHTSVFDIEVWSKEGMSLTLANRTYKNVDVVRYLAQQIKTAIHSNRVPMFWSPLYDWKITRERRVTADEADLGMFRYSLTLEVMYFDNGDGG